MVDCMGQLWTLLSQKLNTNTFTTTNYYIWYCSYFVTIDNIFCHRWFFFCSVVHFFIILLSTQSRMFLYGTVHRHLFTKFRESIYQTSPQTAVASATTLMFTITITITIKNKTTIIIISFFIITTSSINNNNHHHHHHQYFHHQTSSQTAATITITITNTNTIINKNKLSSIFSSPQTVAATITIRNKNKNDYNDHYHLIWSINSRSEISTIKHLLALQCQIQMAH